MWELWSLWHTQILSLTLWLFCICWTVDWSAAIWHYYFFHFFAKFWEVVFNFCLWTLWWRIERWVHQLVISFANTTGWALVTISDFNFIWSLDNRSLREGMWMAFLYSMKSLATWDCWNCLSKVGPLLGLICKSSHWWSSLIGFSQLVTGFLSTQTL